MAYFRVAPAESPEPLSETDVVAGCGGHAVHLGGVEADLLRLHNEPGKNTRRTALRQGTAHGGCQGHSEDMIERGYYTHDTPNSVEPADRVRATGYDYSLTAENIHMLPISYDDEPSASDLEQAFED